LTIKEKKKQSDELRITNYKLRKINYELIKMRNSQRRNNQTNQGCVGANLRVCPTIANTIHAERSVFRYVRAKSKALASHTLLHIDCKAGALLLTRRSEGRYAERGNHISNKGTFSFPCPVRDSMFVEENISAIFQPCRQVRNVTVGFYHNHIAYLRHAVIGDTSFFYKHCVPNGTLPTNKIISFCHGTKTFFYKHVVPNGTLQPTKEGVGSNLHVCPAIANSVGINKQTEFSFANAGTSCKLAPKGANIRVRPLTNSKSFCDFLRILREKKIISRRTRRNMQKKTNKELIY
jgi:hypothetical protein